MIKTFFRKLGPAALFLLIPFWAIGQQTDSMTITHTYSANGFSGSGWSYVSTGSPTHYQKTIPMLVNLDSAITFHNFGFNLPANAAVTGFKVSFQRRHNNSTCASSVLRDSVVKINTGTTLSANRGNYAAGNWSTTFTPVSYGSSSDMWGLSNITGLDINNPSFGVTIQGVKAMDGLILCRDNSVIYMISEPTITVYYQSGRPLANNDAALDIFTNPPNAFCPDDQSIAVKIRNAGTNNINNVTVNWSINDVLQTPVVYSGTLVPYSATSGNNTDTVTLGSTYIGSNAQTVIKAWTSAPNNGVDTVNGNDTITRTFQATLTPPNVNLGGDTAICPGDSITLYHGANNPANTVDWNDGSHLNYLGVTSSGTYYVTVTDANGCVGSDTIQVTYRPLPQAAGIDFVQNTDSSIDFSVNNPTNVDDYLWFFGDGNSSTDPAPNHTYDTEGDYNVQLTISNDCGVDTFNTRVHVDYTTGISSSENGTNNLKLYPNPAKNHLIIGYTGASEINNLKVYNILGQEIYQEQSIKNNTIKLDTQNFASGIYHLQITTQTGETIHEKFQVNK